VAFENRCFFLSLNPPLHKYVAVIGRCLYSINFLSSFAKSFKNAICFVLSVLF
jgi:hypothetical protein